MESIDLCIPKKPKKVGWPKKHCLLCQKHRRPHKSYNTCDCDHFNKDGTLMNRMGAQVSPSPKKMDNMLQILCKSWDSIFMKVLCMTIKQWHKHKKCHVNDSDSNNDSDYSSWCCGSDSNKELHTYKKIKISDSIKRYAYLSSSKAITLTKFKLNNKVNFYVTKKEKSTNTCDKNNKSELN